MTASKRPGKRKFATSQPPESREFSTKPAPKDKSTAPSPTSPDADRRQEEVKKVLSYRPGAFTKIAVEAIHSLLMPEKQQQLLEEGMDTVAQYLLSDLYHHLKSNPQEDIASIRIQIKACIELGKLLPTTKQLLIQDLEKYFENEEARIIKDVTPAGIELRKFSRWLHVAINDLLSNCIGKLSFDNINELTTHIYIQLPKPTPQSLFAPGVDIVFKNHLHDFFQENISKKDLSNILDKTDEKYPYLHQNKQRAAVVMKVYELLAECTWKIIRGTPSESS